MGAVSSKTAAKKKPSATSNKKKKSSRYPIYGSEKIMKQKAHGTSETPVQKNLRWDCDFRTADRICNYNRHYAEHSGYAFEKKKFLSDVQKAKKKNTTITFYDSNTGEPLFEAPKGRSMQDFLNESRQHGWLSFRDEEVNWEHVRCLKGGEAVSLAGTHLGHNLPDPNGNRYCINLVSVAGRPSTAAADEENEAHVEASPETRDY